MKGKQMKYAFTFLVGAAVGYLLRDNYILEFEVGPAEEGAR